MPRTRTQQIRLVTFRAFRAGRTFIRRVHHEATDAFDGQPPADIDVRECVDAPGMVQALSEPATLIVVSGHGFRPQPGLPDGGIGATRWTDDGPLLRWHEFTSHSQGRRIASTGLIMDSCYTGRPDHLTTISGVLSHDTGYVGFRSTVRTRQSTTVILPLVIELLRQSQHTILTPDIVAATAHQLTAGNPHKIPHWTPVVTTRLSPPDQ
ncbi:hypothetical protein [Amycolatopsis sp. NPDC004378]